MLSLALIAVVESRAASPKKPNVIVLMVDDLGVGDLGFSGAKDIPTPHLDRLASEGIIFRNGYAYPMCAPSRAAFLSGRHPEKIGFEDNRPGDSPHFGMNLSVKTVANILHDVGYATGLLGKWHVGRGLNNEYSPWNRGFDEFLGYYGAFGTFVNPKLTRQTGEEKTVEGYSTDIYTEAACDFIQRHKDQPFFLNVAFNAAHLVQAAKPEDLAKFQYIENPKRRLAAAIISNLDVNIGRIAARLEELHLDRNTLLVFVSDNGGEPPILGTMNGPLRGKKFDLYEGGIRVPFFVRWADGLPAGKTSDALVSMIDLFPTIAAAAGAKVPKGIDSVNLLPYLRGKTSKKPHNTLFWRTTEHAALKKMRQRTNAVPPVYVPHISAVREGSWKLLAFDDAGKNPRFELYDLASDPSEQNNLSEKQPKVVRKLSYKLDVWKTTLQPQIIPPIKKPQT
ncbi:MAG: sulfatase-like hydrolase/transferase [Verrucomicrobiota bacterium]